MDGERVMIHFGRSSRADASFGSVPAGGGASASAKLAFWTRSRKDFTKQYEADMAPILEKALLPSVVSCILDGARAPIYRIMHLLLFVYHLLTCMRAVHLYQPPLITMPRTALHCTLQVR